jgi:hypothetical protein
MRRLFSDRSALAFHTRAAEDWFWGQSNPFKLSYLSQVAMTKPVVLQLLFGAVLELVVSTRDKRTINFTTLQAGLC